MENGGAEPNGVSDSDPTKNGSLFQRRIEFHIARKQYNGFSNGASGFMIETLNPCSGNSNKRVGSNAGQSNGSVGVRTDVSDLIDIGLDPELIFGFSLRKVGAGLENLGNTCFLNSVLQCLTHTEPLAAYLQSGKHQNSCRVAGFCALCSIQRHVSRALQSSGRTVSPKDLVSNLRCISRNFRNARQEDAHEYMINLLESMHKCCLPSGVPSESPSAYEKSLVHKIFGGRLRSRVKCLQCSYCSDTYDPLIDLSLEIEKADSLCKALMNFTAAEKLDGGEKQYNCQQCKQKVRALKQLTVHKAPYVLTIHLKRFRAHNPGQKIDKKIQFDPTLDLKPFVSGAYKGDLKYTLYGVLVHYGWSTHSGHYYCFVRTSSGMWHSLDDNRVVPVSERKVLEQKAYMLFYVRDRGSLVPRKPASVTHKENTKANLSGHRPCPNISHALREMNQNGVEESTPKLFNPPSLIQKDAVLPKTDIVKVEPKSITNDSLARENLFVKTDHSLQSSTKEQKTTDPLKGMSDSTSTSGREKILPSLASSVTSNGCTPHDHENGGVKVEAKDKDSNGTLGSQKNPGVSALCNGPQESAADKVLADTVCQKGALVIPSYHDLEANKSQKIDLVRSSSKPSPSQAKSLPRDSDSIVERNGDDRLKSSLESVEPSNGTMGRKASDNTCRRKCKKRLLNGRSATMPFGTSMFFRASLRLRKKKKLKRSKHRASDTQNLIQESLLKSDTFSLDCGPSTSEKTNTVLLETFSSNKKREKSSSNKEGKKYSKSEPSGSRGESIIHKDGEFQGRVNKTSTILTADGQNSQSPSIAEDQFNVPESKIAGDCRGDAVQNGFMGMLTRGLEEPVVARWDDIDLPSRQVVESTSKENIHIGYVPDEWDEEYDRGKRKKLRQFKHEFGGPNLFQEIANEKIQYTKTKMHQSSSGNKPYRI